MSAASSALPPWSHSRAFLGPCPVPICYARATAPARPPLPQKLTCCESVWNCFGCTVCCLATCGCAGFITVPASTNVAIFRCGKLDGEITTPGCHWVNPCYQRKVQQFAGTQTEKMDQLHVIDAYVCHHPFLSFSVALPLCGCASP